jgi:hypothetical protein
MNDLNFEQDIAIDPNSLDTEWLGQASLMLDYTKHLAECEKTVNTLKDAVKATKAEIGKDVRSDPKAYGIEKLSNDSVEEAVLSDKEYKRVQRELVEAQYEADIAKGAVESFRQRKSALENLVQLFMSQYFAGPKIPRDLSKEWEDKQRQKTANQAVRIQRTRRTK